MSHPEPASLDIPVPGGQLRALAWGTGSKLAVALHGISGSAMSWRAVGGAMPDGWTLVAPDLRGRGASGGLPGPYGFGRHADDLAAVVEYLGVTPAVLAGHSMGAYVALLASDARPELAARLILIDGGLPLPVPEGADLDAVLDVTLGPAIARLSQTFSSTAAYVDFWRAHPAFAGHWTADAEAYVRYDLTGADGSFRSRVAEDAVREDGRELLSSEPRLTAALDRLASPVTLMTAPAGMFGAPPGMLPAELVASWQRRAPQLRPQLVPDVNHYTVLFDPAAVAVVIRALTGAAGG
jgi:pimeloyl-ACP methyl ester carboxylesterase